MFDGEDQTTCDNEDEATCEAEDKSEIVTTISSDISDFETDEIEDNFQVGLTTNGNEVQEKTSTSVEKQIVYVLRSE